MINEIINKNIAYKFKTAHTVPNVPRDRGLVQLSYQVSNTATPVIS